MAIETPNDAIHVGIAPRGAKGGLRCAAASLSPLDPSHQPFTVAPLNLTGSPPWLETRGDRTPCGS